MKNLTKILILFLACFILYGQTGGVLWNPILKGKLVGSGSAFIDIDSTNVEHLVVNTNIIFGAAAGNLLLEDGSSLTFTDGTEADSTTLQHDGTDFVITGDAGTTALELESLELELSNGATIVNTDASNLAITEANLNVVGNLFLDAAAGSMTISDGSSLVLTDGAETDSTTFQHDGSDFVFTSDAGTDAYNFDKGVDITISTTVAGGERGVYSYVTHTTNALTGELIGVRGNARVDAIDSPSGQPIGGKFQAGNMGTGTDLSAVRGVYIDVVNKIPSGATTWDHARGVEVSMDLDQGSAGNVNTVTNAQGLYICYNLPTSGSYATVTNGYGVYIKNEAVGGTGQALDAAIFIDDASMSGGIKGWDYGVDLTGVAAGFTVSDLKLSSGARVFTVSAANGDAVYAEVGSIDATGSIYLTTAGAIYIQVANNGAAADWYKVTATDAD